MKISILFVIENATYGGGEHVFELIIEKIDKTKFDLFIACKNEGVLPERIKNFAKVIPLDLKSRINVKNIFYLKKIIEKNKIDIVHSQGARADFYARMASKLAKVSNICSLAMLVEGFNVSMLKKRFYKIFDSFSEKFVDKFIVCSQSLINFLVKKHKIPKEKIKLIYNGVDFERTKVNQEKVNEIRKEFRVEGNKILVGTIGRLVWQKGFCYFVEAISMLVKSLEPSLVKTIEFVIVGDGEEKINLMNQAKSLGVEDKIIFSGFRKDVNEILVALDIFVLPSILEGQPFVLIEAMAQGKPIIATNIDGVNETVFDGKTAVIVPPNDSKSIKEAIKMLLIDREKMKTIGFAAKKYAEKHFNFNILIKHYESVYEEMYHLNKKQ